MKKIISIVLVIIWMILIFLLSNVNGKNSTKASTGLIYKTVEITSNVLEKINIIKPLTNNEIEEIANKLNYPVRKILHVTEYFILTLLIFNVLINYKVKKIYILTLLSSVLYAISDEFHQLFTGRTGTIIDVLIDSIGILLAIYLLKKIMKIRLKKSNF